MDSHFINFDGRSIHDMIELLLAASGDPEAIRRLQESINAVDQRAQSSIAVVNAAVEKLDTEVDVVANAGAKNMAAREGGTVLVTNGITFTLNDNQSVTVNGTASAHAYYPLKTNFNLKAMKYTLSVGNTGLTAGASMQVLDKPNVNVSGVSSLKDVFSGKSELTITEDLVGSAYLVVRNGSTIDNVTFYPMIRDAVITDDTYVPYGKTNAEITSELTDTGWLTLELESGVSGLIRYRKKNGIVYMNLNNVVPNIGTSWGASVGTLPTGFRPSLQTVLEVYYGSHNSGHMMILQSGTIQFSKDVSATAESGGFYGEVSFPV